MGKRKRAVEFEIEPSSIHDLDLDHMVTTASDDEVRRMRKCVSSCLIAMGIKNHLMVWRHLKQTRNHAIFEMEDPPNSVYYADFYRKNELVLMYDKSRFSLVIVHVTSCNVVPFCWKEDCENVPQPSIYLVCSCHFAECHEWFQSIPVISSTMGPLNFVQRGTQEHYTHWQFRTAHVDGSRIKAALIALRTTLRQKKSRLMKPLDILDLRPADFVLIKEHLRKWIYEFDGLILSFSYQTGHIIYRRHENTEWITVCSKDCPNPTTTFNSTCTTHFTGKRSELVLKAILYIVKLESFSNWTTDHLEKLKNFLRSQMRCRVRLDEIASLTCAGENISLFIRGQCIVMCSNFGVNCQRFGPHPSCVINTYRVILFYRPSTASYLLESKLEYLENKGDKIIIDIPDLKSDRERGSYVVALFLLMMIMLPEKKFKIINKVLNTGPFVVRCLVRLLQEANMEMRNTDKFDPSHRTLQYVQGEAPKKGKVYHAINELTKLAYVGQTAQPVKGIRPRYQETTRFELLRGVGRIRERDLAFVENDDDLFLAETIHILAFQLLEQQFTQDFELVNKTINIKDMRPAHMQDILAVVHQEVGVGIKFDQIGEKNNILDPRRNEPLKIVHE